MSPEEGFHDPDGDGHASSFCASFIEELAAAGKQTTIKYLVKDEREM